MTPSPLGVELLAAEASPSMPCSLRMRPTRMRLAKAPPGMIQAATMLALDLAVLLAGDKLSD
jgi:hypothetical protein